jgi:hypothetical protein
MVAHASPRGKGCLACQTLASFVGEQFRQRVYGELVLRRLWVAGIGRGNVISTGIG